MGLATAATIKITEKRLPPSNSDRDSDCLTSGRDIPRVATAMEGRRLAQGAISVVGQSTFEWFTTILFAFDLLFFKGDLGVKARRITYDPGDVAPACEIVCQHDVSRPKAFLRAIADLNLALAG